MNRWKNYALWLAIASLVPLLADALKVYDISIVLPGNYEKLVTAILGILVLAGILNSPTTKNRWYKDDDNES